MPLGCREKPRRLRLLLCPKCALSRMSSASAGKPSALRRFSALQGSDLYLRQGGTCGANVGILASGSARANLQVRWTLADAKVLFCTCAAHPLVAAPTPHLRRVDQGSGTVGVGGIGSRRTRARWRNWGEGEGKGLAALVDSRLSCIVRRFSCNIMRFPALLGRRGGGNKGAQKRRRRGSLAEGEDAPDLRALGPVPRFSSQLKKMLSPAKGKRGWLRGKEI